MDTQAKEKTYTDTEVEERLQKDLPKWYLEKGWIRRKYKTNSWKGTLMIGNYIFALIERGARIAAD